MKEGKAKSWGECDNLLIKSDLKTVFQGRDYTVFGLPFFNETGKENTAFTAAFQKFMDGKGERQ